MDMKQVSFRNYGEYSSDNYGVHTLAFSTDKGEFFFSYTTLVAFRSAKTGFVIRENAWGPTTGKHLNWLDRDHSKRVDLETFDKLYNEAFGEAQS